MRVDRLALIRALKTVTPIIERRNTIPVLSTARLSVSDKLVIEATDLDLHLRVAIPCEGNVIDYCQMAPASLIPLLKASAAETVEIEGGKDAGYRLDAGELQVKLGRGLPSDDMPIFAPVTETWNANVGSEFMDKIKRVALAQSGEETRYYLNGIYMHHLADWDYRLVATDGHRLIYANVQLPDASTNDGMKHMAEKGAGGGVIIPRKAIATMMRLHAEQRDEPIRLGLAVALPANDKAKATDLLNAQKSRATFEVGNVRMQTKLIDGTFPDYTRVIPQEGGHVAEMQLADLRRVVGALVGFVTERTRAIKMRFEGKKLTVSASNIDMGAEAALSIPIDSSGGDFEVGFNGRYLLTALSAAGGEVTRFSTNDSAAPTLFYDPSSTDVRTVLMPMRC